MTSKSTQDSILTTTKGILARRFGFDSLRPEQAPVVDRLIAGGSALVLAAGKIVAKARKLAAHLMEASEGDLEFADGRFIVAGTDKAMTLQDVARAAFQPARLPPGVEPGLYETATYAPEKPTFPNSAHACEVEIDPETGTVEMIGYWVVDDVGTVINPKTLAGQVHGGVVQGVGQVLMEQVNYDPESGQLMSASFMDYAMPRASDVCNIAIESNPQPTGRNLLGAKGAGEAGTVGAFPSVMIAVVDALKQVGVKDIDMPATPDRIWRAIRDAGSA